jgi:hypothetical protein
VTGVYSSSDAEQHGPGAQLNVFGVVAASARLLVTLSASRSTDWLGSGALMEVFGIGTPYRLEPRAWLTTSVRLGPDGPAPFVPGIDTGWSLSLTRLCEPTMKRLKVQ